MNRSQRLAEATKEMIEEEADRRAKKFPVRVFLGGEEISLDDQWTENEEIHLSLENPIYFVKSGKTGYVVPGTPEKMVG